MAEYPALIDLRDIDPVKWDDLLSGSAQANIFLELWYLKALQLPVKIAVIKDENGNYTAALPLPLKKKGMIRYCLQPVFTRYWGCLIRDTEKGNNFQKYQNMNKLVVALVKLIPANLFKLELYLSPVFKYPLPFAWKGYQLHQRFTLTIDLGQGMEAIRKNYKPTVLNRIRKAGKAEFNLTSDLNSDILTRILKANEDEGKKILDAAFFPVLKSITSIAYENKKGYALTARDENKNAIATAFFLSDRHTTYFLIGVVMPAHRNSGIMNLLMDKGIEEACRHSSTFDFFGSMIENIENFFRSFGASPVSYTVVKKKSISVPGIPFFTSGKP